MSRTIKFSEFSLPTNGTSDLYLVGYVEGEENTNVKISANDLSFSASGSAGVASVNGKNGLIQIQGDKGVTITEHDNVLTISGQNITIDQTFDGTSQNPQSGAAISSQLENVAKTDAVATFKNDLIVWGDTDCKWIYGQGLTVNGNSTFNGNVIVEGRNISNTLGAIDTHIADYFIHVTPENKAIWDNKVELATLEQHSNNAAVHFSSDERETLNNLSYHISDAALHIKEEERVIWNATSYTTANISPNGTTEDNYNGYGFGCVMPRSGKITALTLQCRHDGTVSPADTPIWLKVWRGGTQELITRSKNPQEHQLDATLYYTFEAPFTVEEGEEIKVSFHAEEGLAETGYYMGRECCLRVVDKDPSEPGGMLGNMGGYGADSDPTQRSWIPKYVWQMEILHANDNVAHLSMEEHAALTQLLNNKDALLALLTTQNA